MVMEHGTAPDREAEAFARVWRRVSPDPERGPIQCVAQPPEENAPAPPGGAERSVSAAPPVRPRRPVRAGTFPTPAPVLAALALAAAIFINHS